MATVTLIPTSKGPLTATIIGIVNIGEGALTPSQQAKLDGIEEQATKNESDEWYSKRINRDVGLLSAPEITCEGVNITVGECTAYLNKTPEFGPNIPVGNPVVLSEATFELPIEYTPYHVVAYQPPEGDAVYALEMNKHLRAKPNRVHVATVIRVGEDFHVIQSSVKGVALAEQLEQQSLRYEGFRRLSGLDLDVSEWGVAVGSGEVGYGATVLQLDPTDSSVAGMTLFVNEDGAWNATTVSLVDNVHFNGTAGLVELEDRHFTVNWIWRGVSDKPTIFTALASEQYGSLAEAYQTKPPTLPNYAADYSVLLGGVVYLKGEPTPRGIIHPAAGDMQYPVAHNDYSEVQGGLPDQKYHLSKDEYDYLRAWMAVNPL